MNNNYETKQTACQCYLLIAYIEKINTKKTIKTVKKTKIKLANQVYGIIPIALILYLILATVTFILSLLFCSYDTLFP